MAGRRQNKRTFHYASWTGIASTFKSGINGKPEIDWLAEAEEENQQQILSIDGKQQNQSEM